MAKLLYMENSYLKEFEANVIETGENYIVLDQTAFFPTGGGVPHDTGQIESNGTGGQISEIVDVKKDFNDDGKIKHFVLGEIPKVGETIKGKINWERRYQFMKMHTAAHLLCGVFNKETGCLITGNQIDLDKTRMDLTAENFDKDKLGDYFQMANKLINKDLMIKIYTMPREEAEKEPEMFKLANKLPPAVKELRIVEIDNFDRQPDGGCHVKTLKEVGKIEFVRFDNRGANNKRVYFTIA